MSLLPDFWLVILQAVPFLFCIWMLNAIIFKPMLAYLEERDAATVGSREDALRLQQEAELKLAEYEQKLAATRHELASLRAANRDEAMEARDVRIGEARAEAEAEIAAAVERIAGERQLAARQLDTVARELATDIAERVLGKTAA